MSDWFGAAINQQPSGGTAYPFVDPPEMLRYLVSDCWLVYPDDTSRFELPLKVTRLLGFDVLAGDKNVIIVDAANVVVIDTTSATSRTKTAWGSNFVTLTWRKGETILRMTMRLAAPPWDPSRSRSADVQPVGGAELDARTYTRLPRHIRSIRIGATTIAAGNLLFEEGFNTRLNATPFTIGDGVRRLNQIAIRMQPGDGLGRRPGCDDTLTPPIKRVNGVGPTPSGDFTLEGSDCYPVRRPTQVTNSSPRRVEIYAAGLTAEESRSSLQIGSNCVPCCVCDDYVRTYRGLNRLDLRYRGLAGRAEGVRDLLKVNADRWTAQRACRMFQSLRLIVNAEDRNTLFIGGLHCNMTDSCVSDLTLRLTLETYNDGALVTPTSAIVKCKEPKRAGADTDYEEVPFVPSGGGYPVYDAHFDTSDPRGTSRLRVRIRIPEGTAAWTVRTTLSVHAPDMPGVILPDPRLVVIPGTVLAEWLTHPPPSPTRAILTRSAALKPGVGCDCA